MGSKQSNDTQNLAKVETYEFKTPTTFVKPDLVQELPIFENYCGGSKFDNFHCQNLQRLLFAAANSQYKGDEIFDSITQGIGGESWQQIYHINKLMENDKRHDVVYNTVKQFKEKCDELETKHDATYRSLVLVSLKENENETTQ
jgi:hypothetical protein